MLTRVGARPSTQAAMGAHSRASPLRHGLEAPPLLRLRSLVSGLVNGWDGVRVYPKFRVGFFGFFRFRVSSSRTHTRTRTFGYPQFRVPANSGLGLGKFRVPVTINHIQDIYMTMESQNTRVT